MVDIDSENEITVLRKKAFYLEVISSFATNLLSAKSVDEIVWMIAKHAVGQIGYEDCVVYLLDNESGELRQVAAHGPKNPIDFDINNPITIQLGKGIVGSVAVSCKGEIVGNTSVDPRYILDDAPRLSEITIPILANGKAIGIIDSEHSDKGFYSKDDLEVLTTIASMSSIKLEEVRIQSELLAHKTMLEDIVLSKTRELQSTVLELQESNIQISNRNKENSLLIKEIHHRVKNNLQILSSLMNFQVEASDLQSTKDVFRECRNRIHSMSTIHDQLYTGGSMTEINTKQYIEEIADDLLRSFGALPRVELNLNLEEIYLDIDTSIPLGLILNELIVNALKHGIKNNRGKLSIELQLINHKVRLQINDTGEGFDVDKTTYSTLGMELIDTLTTQLDGELKYQSDSTGTTCTIVFPI